MSEYNVKKCIVCGKSFYIGDRIWDMELSMKLYKKGIDTTGKFTINPNGKLTCNKCYDEKFGLDIEDRVD